MALFKILQGNQGNLPTRTTSTIGQCYVTLDTHKLFIDANTERFALNAVKADTADVANKLSSGTVGNANLPVWFSNGTPQPCENSLNVNISGNANTVTNGIYTYTRSQIGTSPNFDNPGVNGLFEIRSSSETTGESGIKPFNSFGPFLNLKTHDNVAMLQLAGTNNSGFWVRGKQAGNVTLANTEWLRLITHTSSITLSGDVTGSATFSATNGNISIATTIIDNSHNHTNYLPLSGGTMTGNLYTPHVHIKNDNAQYINIAMSGSGRFSFEMIPDTKAMRQHFRYKDNTTGYYNDFYLGDGETSLSSTAGYNILTAKNYTNYTVTKTGSGASGTWGINVSGSATKLTSNTTMTYGWNGLNYFNASMTANAGAAGANDSPTSDWYHIIRMNHANSNGYYFDIASCFHNDNMFFKRVASGSSSGWKHIWVQGNSVTGAVWNDYAECRESDCENFGYVLMEKGDDSLTKTVERLSHFAGISSDTWGFSQGETDKAKTPIAVAGRVLVYPYQDRNNYKSGDCVCAAPGGTVDIMTREEVIQYPDRIVGTVSCVPEYEEWGGGEGADRDPVKVNGRIWIKVR